MATISNVQLRINSVQNTTYRRALVALLAALSVVSFVGATSQTAMAGVKCKPNVRVTNKQGASIKVLNFKYKIGSNTIYTEGLVNKVLTPNETENWPSQTLNNAATGVVLTPSFSQCGSAAIFPPFPEGAAILKIWNISYYFVEKVGEKAF